MYKYMVLSVLFEIKLALKRREIWICFIFYWPQTISCSPIEISPIL